VIECKDGTHAMDEVSMEEVDEFGQQHISECIIGCREIDDDEATRLFFEDHPYLAECGPEKALSYVHKIEYDE